MKTIHYVYAYLDPLKPVRVSTSVCSFLFEPFYIGKGKKKRDISHLKNPDCRKNLPFYNKIKKMIINGNAPIVVRVLETNDQQSALDIEVDMIATIKRKHEGGSLLNITAGGEGFRDPAPRPTGRKSWNNGLQMPVETKLKLSLSVAGFKHTNEAKAKIALRSSGANNPGAKS